MNVCHMVASFRENLRVSWYDCRDMKCIRSNVRFDGYRLNQNTRSWSPGYQLRSNEITNLTLVAFAWSRALHSNLQGLNLYICTRRTLRVPSSSFWSKKKRSCDLRLEIANLSITMEDTRAKLNLYSKISINLW